MNYKPINEKDRYPIRNYILYLFMFFFFALIILYLILQSKNKQIFEFKQSSNPITNPLVGFAPWATIKKSEQPHSLVYVDMTWAEIEPKEGVFTFYKFKEKQQLDRWRNEGKKVVFRFVIDKPGEALELNIPDWLFEKINGDGDFYDVNYGKGFSPNYSNPIFIEYHKKVISAIGENYGQNTFFAFIELGSLGHWGEWHVKSNSEIRQLPNTDIRNQYVMHYIEAFPNAKFLMRRPFAIAAEIGLGIFNDMTGDLNATNRWLNWIDNGGEYNQTGEEYALAAMPNGWQIAPIGGEQTSSLSDEEFYSTFIDQTISLLEKSHTTFIGPGSPYSIVSGGPLQSGIDYVVSTIGYRFYINKVVMDKWVFYGDQINIQIEIGNSGIAPFYFNFPVQLYIFNSEGFLLQTTPLEVKINEILPGNIFEIQGSIDVKEFPNGSYSVGIAIIDPDTRQPAVIFANQGFENSKIPILGEFEIFKLLSK